MDLNKNTEQDMNSVTITNRQSVGPSTNRESQRSNITESLDTIGLVKPTSFFVTRLVPEIQIRRGGHHRPEHHHERRRKTKNRKGEKIHPREDHQHQAGDFGGYPDSLDVKFRLRYLHSADHGKTNHFYSFENSEVVLSTFGD